MTNLCANPSESIFCLRIYKCVPTQRCPEEHTDSAEGIYLRGTMPGSPTTGTHGAFRSNGTPSFDITFSCAEVSICQYGYNVVIQHRWVSWSLLIEGLSAFKHYLWSHYPIPLRIRDYANVFIMFPDWLIALTLKDKDPEQKHLNFRNCQI